MKFDILNRWNGDVQFTAEIKCADELLAAAKADGRGIEAEKDAA